jgi:hypothetical protein
VLEVTGWQEPKQTVNMAASSACNTQAKSLLLTMMMDGVPCQFLSLVSQALTNMNVLLMLPSVAACMKYAGKLHP